MTVLSIFTFQDNATTIGSGTEYNNINASTITFEITGTSTSRTIVFEAASLSGVYYPVECKNLLTVDIKDNQTTGINEVWQVDISGFQKFRTRISSITGGTVNIVGKVIQYRI